MSYFGETIPPTPIGPLQLRRTFKKRFASWALPLLGWGCKRRRVSDGWGHLYEIDLRVASGKKVPLSACLTEVAGSQKLY